MLKSTLFPNSPARNTFYLKKLGHFIEYKYTYFIYIYIYTIRVYYITMLFICIACRRII